MKYIFLILFHAGVVFAQNSSVQYYYWNTPGAIDAPSYDADAQAYFSRGTFSDTLKTAIDTFIKGLKTDLNETNLNDIADRIWFATENEAASRVDWVTGDTLTNWGTTFTPFLGWLGNGTSTWMNTNYNPTVDAINYSLNNGSLMIYSRTDINNGRDFGVFVSGQTRGSFVFIRLGNKLYTGINSLDQAAFGMNHSLGLRSVTRKDADSLYSYINDTLRIRDVKVSGTLTNADLYVSCDNNGSGTAGNFAARQYPFFGVFRHFTQAEYLLVYARIKAFLTYTGANVIP